MEEHGRITFERFMELALYAPGEGYYRRGRDPFGKSGDFFTAEQLAPFAELIRAFIQRREREMHPRESCRVLELGAGRRELREALAPWNYVGFDWDSESLPAPAAGVILANEFFDALPVHLLRRPNPETEWRSVSVIQENGRLVYVDDPVREPDVQKYLERYAPFLTSNVAAEVNLQLPAWVARVAHLLRTGLLLVIDYGYEARELPRFPEGTLLSYRKHVAGQELLADPGARDITAHVNLTELIRLCREHGLALQYKGSLQGWALSQWDEPALAALMAERGRKWIGEWKQLVFGMGEAFRVLVFQGEERKREQ